MKAFERVMWLLVSFVACGFASCFGPDHYMYVAQELERGRMDRVVLWPRDVDGASFGYVIDKAEQGTASDADVEHLPWPGAIPERLTVPLCGATLLLGPDHSPEQRWRGDELLAALEACHPWISTHVIVCADPLPPIRDATDLEGYLSTLHQRASVERPTSWNDMFRMLMSPVCDSMFIAGFAVFPDPHDVDRFYVVGEGSNHIFTYGATAQPFIQSLCREELVELVRDCYTRDVANSREPHWTILVLPFDAGAETRDALIDVSKQLKEARASGIVIMPMDLPRGSLDDVDSLRKTLQEQSAGRLL